MRNYSVHSLKKNQKISKIWNVKKADFQNFIRLSGDKNPILSNFNYAVSKGYKNIIAPGFLLGSKVSGIIGTFLPGKRCLLLEEFKKSCASEYQTWTKRYLLDDPNQNNEQEKKFLGNPTRRSGFFAFEDPYQTGHNGISDFSDGKIRFGEFFTSKLLGDHKDGPVKVFIQDINRVFPQSSKADALSVVCLVLANIRSKILPDIKELEKLFTIDEQVSQVTCIRYAICLGIMQIIYTLIDQVHYIYN